MQYIEQVDENAPVVNLKEDELKKIIEYLKKGTEKAISLEISRDLFTKENVRGNIYLMTDGEFTWRSDVAYYLEKYKKAYLPQEFIDKVLK